MLTSMQRFAALQKGQLPDRVPIICNLMEQGAQELGLSIQDYYQSGEQVARGQLALCQKYGYDSLLGIFYAALDAEVLGCKNLIYASDGPPNVGQLVIRKKEDIALLKGSDNLHQHPRMRELLRCIRRLKEESAGRWPVLGAATASFSLPAMLMGIGPWLELCLWGDPQLRETLLQLCSRFCTAKIQALCEAGADFIIYTNPVASSSFITPDKFRERALPWVLRDLESVGTAGLVYFNGGGIINPILADLQQNTAIGAYYLNPFDDIAEARQILGPNKLLVGTINDIPLLTWSPAEIDVEVRRIMTEGKAAGGFIFGTLMMPCNIPAANIQALMQAAQDHGRYDREEAKR